MNTREEALLNARLKKINKEIHVLEKVDREQRNFEKVNDLKARSQRLRQWRDGKSEVVTKTSMSRQEFKERFFDGMKKSEKIIEINTIDELTQAWPHIRGSNITVDCKTKEVYDEMIRLNKIFANQVGNTKGFRI